LSWIEDVRSELARADLSPRAARGFALVLAIALLAVAAWLLLRRDAATAAAAAAGVALALAAAGLLRPAALRPLHRGWTALGLALGWFASRLVLAALFYGVVTPLGLLRRATRGRARPAPAATYWTRRAPRPPRYDKMF
jgi:hypothetical protein